MELKQTEHLEVMQTWYEVLVDFGEDGTKTIFTSNTYEQCLKCVENLAQGIIEDREIDLDEDELEAIEKVYINFALFAPSLEFVPLHNEDSAYAPIDTFTVTNKRKEV